MNNRSTGSGVGWAGVEVPAEVVEKVAASPVLSNLVAALAFHKGCLDWVPLEKVEWEGVEGTVMELQDTLKSILCL